MGLVSTTYYTSSTGVTRYGYDRSTKKIKYVIPYTQQWDIAGVNYFIYNDQSLENYTGNLRLCQIPITTNGSGASSVSFSCNGDFDGFSHIYWKIQSTKLNLKAEDTYTLSGGTQCTKSQSSGAGIGNITYSGTININLMPNTTYYVIFYCVQGSHSYNYASCLRSGMTITGGGAYGTKGTVTTNKNSLNFGEAVSVSFASPNHTSGSTTYTVVASAESISKTLQSSSATQTLSWTPAYTDFAAFTDRKTVTIRITATTYFGGTSVGSSYKDISVSFTAAQVGVTIASGCFSIAPYNAGQISGMSGYIQNYSKVRATYDSSKVTTKSGASVSKWTLKVGNASALDAASSASTKDSDVITATATVVCTVVDSRGFTASQEFTATVIPYQQPTIANASTVERCNSSGTPTSDGAYAIVNVAVTYAGIAYNSTDQNTISVKLYVKLASSSDWPAQGLNVTDNAQYTPDGTNIIFSAIQIYSGFLDVTYNVKLVATDSLGNFKELYFTLASDSWFLNAYTNGSGAAFGKAAEYQNVLDVGTWDIYLRDGNGNVKSLKTLLNIT